MLMKRRKKKKGRRVLNLGAVEEEGGYHPTAFEAACVVVASSGYSLEIASSFLLPVAVGAAAAAVGDQSKQAFVAAFVVDVAGDLWPAVV